MSAKGRGSAPVEFGKYPTPRWAVHRLLERCPLPGLRWLEYGADTGEIIRATAEVLSQRVEWTACEIRHECAEPLRETGARVVIGDFLSDLPDLGDGFDVAIGNPDYEIAPEVIARARSRARVTAALLRLNYFGSEERLSSFADDMPDTLILPNRPTFLIRVKLHRDGSITKSTSDNCESAWFVWREVKRREGSNCVLAATPKAVRKAARLLAPVVIEDDREADAPPVRSVLPWLDEHRGPVSVVTKRTMPSAREEMIDG